MNIRVLLLISMTAMYIIDVRAQDVILPSYDCNKASNETFRLICSDQSMARKEFEFSQAYQARRFSLTEADYTELRKGVLAFYDETNRTCTAESPFENWING